MMMMMRGVVGRCCCWENRVGATKQATFIGSCIFSFSLPYISLYRTNSNNWNRKDNKRKYIWVNDMHNKQENMQPPRQWILQKSSFHLRRWSHFINTWHASSVAKQIHGRNHNQGRKQWKELAGVVQLTTCQLHFWICWCCWCLMFDVDFVVVVWSRRYGTQHRTFYCRCLTSLRFWPVLVQWFGQ